MNILRPYYCHNKISNITNWPILLANAGVLPTSYWTSWCTFSLPTYPATWFLCKMALQCNVSDRLSIILPIKGKIIYLHHIQRIFDLIESLAFLTIHCSVPHFNFLLYENTLKSSRNNFLCASYSHILTIKEWITNKKVGWIY